MLNAKDRKPTITTILRHLYMNKVKQLFLNLDTLEKHVLQTYTKDTVGQADISQWQP